MTSPTRGSHYSPFCPHRSFHLFLNLTEVKSCNRCSLMSGFIHSAECFEIHLCCCVDQYFVSFYWRVTFHCIIVPKFCLSILLMEIRAVSSFWLLWIRMLWTFLYSCGRIFHFFCVKYLGVVESLANRINVCLTLFKICQREFQNHTILHAYHFALFQLSMIYVW